MGNHHGNKWRRALPWVLLGKRVAFQPDLDTSSALLAFGRSPLIPGQLLGEPGPPLTSLQVKALLEELYRLENSPALQTSSTPKELDISETDAVSHVYVKVEEPKGLAPRFEGPFEVISRPSRSQVQVRIGSYVSGEPRLLTYHWSSCKIAHMRKDAAVGSRPNLGRRPQPQVEPLQPVPNPTVISPEVRPAASNDRAWVNKTPMEYQHTSSNENSKQTRGAEIQTDKTDIPLRPIRSSRNPSPKYVHAISKTCTPFYSIK